MNALNFRALLVDSGNKTQERPVQVFASCREEIDRWAKEVLKQAVADNAAVLVYQTVESQVGLIVKPKKEEGPAA